MLPILPYRLLVPLALGTAILFFLLIGVLVARRFLLARGEGGSRATRQAQARLLDAAEDAGAAEAVVRWIAGGRPARVRTFVAAARGLEASHPEWREWLVRSEIPGTLARLGAPSEGRRPGRWNRAAALMAIGQLRLDEHDALVRALDDRDPDVAYVAAEALARLDTPQGVRAIFERIGGQSRLLDSRLASLIEGMTCDVREVLREALRSKNPTIVYWALNLAARRKEVELVQGVKPHLASETPNVRAAACECVGELGVQDTDAWLSPLLRDEVWYVQCHAAKALGSANAIWAAQEIATLLYSPHWWVRQNATQALSDLGSVSEPLAEKVLGSDDRYARNSAVEVLAHLGWAESTLLRAHRTQSPDALVLLERFATSGGLGYLENALWAVPDGVVPMLLSLLGKVGDAASYGRIRAARTRLPVELQELALATAERVKAR